MNNKTTQTLIDILPWHLSVEDTAADPSTESGLIELTRRMQEHYEQICKMEKVAPVTLSADVIKALAMQYLLYQSFIQRANQREQDACEAYRRAMSITPVTHFPSRGWL